MVTIKNYGEEQGFDNFDQSIEALDIVLLKAQETNSETSVEGTYEMPHGTYTDQDILLQVFEASSEDVAAIRHLIDSAMTRYEYNADILDIIQEESAAYLSGNKPIENVADVIQNRVGLYLNEQMD
ncbi:MAG: hypothetical protein LBM69_01350 [Lachnospiraceae bacterium]|nr:hypothetical protein [Lachnospiraceae bacterium]